MLAAETNPTEEIQEKINQVIFSIYDLTDDEIEVVSNVKELKKLRLEPGAERFATCSAAPHTSSELILKCEALHQSFIFLKKSPQSHKTSASRSLLPQ